MVAGLLVAEGEDVNESGITDIDEVAEVVTGEITSGERAQEDGRSSADTLSARDIVDERSPAPDGEDDGEVKVGLVLGDVFGGGLLGEGLGGAVDDPWVCLLALLLENLGGAGVERGLWSIVIKTREEG